jgi:hypothetical protein
MTATCFVCMLKRSPAEVVLGALRREGVKTEEEWLPTDKRAWSIETGETAAKNLLRTARALR